MKLTLLSFWRSLHQSYWFIPGLMSLLAAGLVIGMLWLDAFLVQLGFSNAGLLPINDANGARTMLSTIAGSSITVAGVVFSITISVLANASSQFGPRLLPNFMNKKGTQFVMGGFLGTFIYSLLLLSQIQSGSEEHGMPQYALLLGLLLGISSFVLLIYFIHHVAMFLHVPRILNDVYIDLRNTLEDCFPDKDSDVETPQDVPDIGEQKTGIMAERPGYLQAIDYDELLAIATRADICLEVKVLPGVFLLPHHVLISFSAHQLVDENTRAQIRTAFLLGDERTSFQDPEFAVDQIAEIAIRALSPGINDPFTAINCIDKLAAAVAFLAERRTAAVCLYDADKKLRLHRVFYDYAGILNKAFHPVRQHAAGTQIIYVRLLNVMEKLAELSLPQTYRTTLNDIARITYEDAMHQVESGADREELEKRFAGFGRA